MSIFTEIIERNKQKANLLCIIGNKDEHEIVVKWCVNNHKSLVNEYMHISRYGFNIERYERNEK